MYKTLACVLLGLVGSGGCGGVQTGSGGVYQADAMTPSGEPAYITVQHCLIGFEGSVPGKQIIRTREQAEQLANELFEKAKSGEEFSKIVTAHTDDSAPGIYRMANTGFPGDMTSSVPSNHVYARGEMVPAFGNTGFPLKVGEVGLAPFDPDTSPYGWHIVKRID